MNQDDKAASAREDARDEVREIEFFDPWRDTFASPSTKSEFRHALEQTGGGDF